MSDKDIYDALLQAVCDEPDVPLHKLALADYFSERGDELRQAAWLELKQRKPHQWKDDPDFDKWWFSDEWEEGKEERYRNEREGYDQAELPDGWVRALSELLFPNANWRYETNRLVYESNLLKMYTTTIDAYVKWKGGNNK